MSVDLAGLAAYDNSAVYSVDGGLPDIQVIGQPDGSDASAYAPPRPAVPAAPEKSAEDKYWEDRAAYEASQRAMQIDSLLAVTRRYFQQAGMGAFLAGMEKYVRAGYSGDAVMVLLANDAEYKAAWEKRFAGNAARRANGLAELLPAQYVEVEQGYKQLLLRYGAPATLFDTPEDFADLIGKDVSVVEMNDRLARAAEYINYAENADVRSQLRDIYDMTDEEMFAYVLDPVRTTDYLESESRRNMNRANVGGAAASTGLSLSSTFRDEIASYYSAVNSPYTSTFGDSMGKFQTVAEQSPLYKRLGQLSAVETSSDELVRAEFGLEGAVQATDKRKKLVADEKARFQGQSGLGATSLSAGRRAQ